MNKLVQHIEYLSQVRDCVIIPGLGAVLAHSVPSRFDSEHNCWNPPYRIFSFNPEVSRNDGLLAQSIARRDSVSLDVATSIVRSEADNFREEYAKTGIINLGGVGRLIKSAQGSMTFEPSNVSWISPEFLWFKSINVQPLKSKVDNHGVDLHVQRKGQLQIALRRAGQVAACLVLIFALGLIINTTLSTSSEEQFASVAPIIDNTVKTENCDNLVVPIVNNITQEDVITEEIEVDTIPMRLDINDKYFLIVASLNSLEEAQQYLNNNSDIKLGILTIDGRYRIYAASSNSYNEALKAGENPVISSRYAEMWVCRR